MIPLSVNDSRIPYLYETIQCGTLRAAAHKMGVAASAIGRQIHLLEDELGVTLIERNQKRLALTQFGQIVIDYYRQHQAHSADMLTRIEALSGLRQGSVSIISGEGFAQELIAGPIALFRKQYPEVVIRLDVAGTTDIMQRLREDEAEIGLVYFAPSESLIVPRVTCRQGMYAIVGRDHPLKDAPHTSLQALQNYPLALLHGVYGIRQLLDHAEHIDKVQLKPIFTTNLISNLSAFVASQQGVTLLPRFAVASQLAAGMVHAIAVNNAVLQNAQVQIITRAGRHLSPAANRFLQYCRQGMQAFQEQA